MIQWCRSVSNYRRVTPSVMSTVALSMPAKLTIRKHELPLISRSSCIVSFSLLYFPHPSQLHSVRYPCVPKPAPFSLYNFFSTIWRLWLTFDPIIALSTLVSDLTPFELTAAYLPTLRRTSKQVSEPHSVTINQFLLSAYRRRRDDFWLAFMCFWWNDG